MSAGGLVGGAGEPVPQLVRDGAGFHDPTVEDTDVRWCHVVALTVREQPPCGRLPEPQGHLVEEGNDAFPSALAVDEQGPAVVFADEVGGSDLGDLGAPQSGVGTEHQGEVRAVVSS